MRSRVLVTLTVALLASAAVIAIGCSSDPLESGSQGLNMTYTPSPSGSGRFDDASFIITRIQALPADPEEAALYGNERLLFRFNPYTADLTLIQPSPYSSIALSAGTYIVTRIEYSPLALVDTDLAPGPYQFCIDGVAVINGSTPSGIPSTFRFDNPPSLTFTIQPGQTSLALTVDVPGLIEDYEAAYTCTYVPCPGCPVDPRPTLTAFDQTAYRNALLANITLK
jgi:hypothetical protein